MSEYNVSQQEDRNFCSCGGWQRGGLTIAGKVIYANDNPTIAVGGSRERAQKIYTNLLKGDARRENWLKQAVWCLWRTLVALALRAAGDVPFDILPHLRPVKTFLSPVERTCGTKMTGSWVIVHGV